MMVRKGPGPASPLSFPAAAILAVEAAGIDLHLIETDKRQRVALTRELRALGLYVRPFAAPRDFLEARAELRPGCVILNAEAALPGSAQQEDGASILAQDWPAFISFDRIETSEALQLVRLGAMDFLRKPIALDELSAVLERAEPYIRELRRHEERKQASMMIDTLSERERAVLEGLAEGLSSKALARRLKLSPRTVEMHRSRIGRKLGVTSLAQLLSIAFAAEEARRY